MGSRALEWKRPGGTSSLVCSRVLDVKPSTDSLAASPTVLVAGLRGETVRVRDGLPGPGQRRAAVGATGAHRRRPAGPEAALLPPGRSPGPRNCDTGVTVMFSRNRK